MTSRLELIAQQLEDSLERQRRHENSIEDEKQLRKNLKLERIALQEAEFLKKYGVAASNVREDYRALVAKSANATTHGHYVKLYEDPEKIGKSAYGRNLINPWSSHIYLVPENYEKCIPTDMIKEAFLVQDLHLWVEPTPHLEVWGN